MRSISILGSTGSIGQSTLDVVARHPDKYRIYALAAKSSVQPMLEQCRRYHPQIAVMEDAAAAAELAHQLQQEGSPIKILHGTTGLSAIAADPAADVVVAAIVGAAGLQSTMAAVNAGKTVLLANKEALVMSGHLFTEAAQRSGACILPVDSEHNAIFQCLPAAWQTLEQAGINKIILTGSGGPFRNAPLETLAAVTPEQACAHPNWDMGKKISVDSATMMNKGLELIEACWLFKARPDQVQVVIHPQSIIHSMVQYADGSVLAQLGRPDMRTPIAHCLAWPERVESGVEALNFYELAKLEFAAPDFARFPCLRLAMAAANLGGDAATALNAANEVAVAGFLAGDLAFTGIAEVIEKVMASWRRAEPNTLDDVINADLRARQLAQQAMQANQNRQERIHRKH